MKSVQDRMLKGLYKTIVGRLVLRCLTKECVSKIAGRFWDCPCSRVLIRPFIRSNQIDMSQYEERKYRSYNDFFTRKIKKENRPILKDSNVLISPCDGAALVFPLAEKNVFSIKGAEYNVQRLLKSKRLARKYQDGTVVILRLDVTDYHRYCHVDTGRMSDYRRIQGVLHTVKPIAHESVPVYHENTREYCMLHSKHFGDVIIMEVGALLVGRIVNDMRYRYVKRGQEKGRFEFGGSTIIMLVEKDQVVFRKDLIEQSQKGIETPVKMGEMLGKK